MDRRSFLLHSGATAAVVPFATGGNMAVAAQAPAGPGDARLNALFEEIFQDRVKRSPELATSLGLDKGANARLKSELDVRPADAGRAEDLGIARRNLADLKAVAPATLSDAAKLNRDVAIKVLLSELAQDNDYLERFRRDAQLLAALNHSNIAAI